MNVKVSPRITSAVAALSLASLSMPAREATAEQTQSLKGSSLVDQKNMEKLGSLDETTFYLQKDGVRRWLVAENRGDHSRVLCPSSGPIDFNASYILKRDSIVKVRVGQDSFAYLPFAGGSFAAL